MKVVASSPADNLDIVIGYGAMIAVIVATAIVLIIAPLAESYINPRVTLIFSRITAITLAALSIQYITNGLQALGVIQIRGQPPQHAHLAKDISFRQIIL